VVRRKNDQADDQSQESREAEAYADADRGGTEADQGEENGVRFHGPNG